MLTDLLAHAGRAPSPPELWTSWNLDPLVLLALASASWLHLRGLRHGGGRPRDRARTRRFRAALAALAVALVSPLEALSAVLASAHMVQHVLLVLVAAPLLAASAPGSVLLRGAPLPVRQVSGRVRRAVGVRASTVRGLGHPATAFLLHVGTMWFWHSAGAYDAALASAPVHALEHATFLATAVLFWRSVVGARAAGRVPDGLGVLLVFGMAMQSVFLSLLLTFAREPWYQGYAATTADWGLEHLADQQLAGVIMWVPAGAIHVAVALTLLASWIRASERGALR